MPFILAENISGGLFAAAVLLGGLMSSILALGAIVPARRRQGRLTFALVAPALLVSLIVTMWIGYGFVTDGLHDPDYGISDFALPWALLAGPSIATSVLAILVFWLTKTRAVAR